MYSTLARDGRSGEDIIKVISNETCSNENSRKLKKNYRAYKSNNKKNPNYLLLILPILPSLDHSGLYTLFIFSSHDWLVEWEVKLESPEKKPVQKCTIGVWIKTVSIQSLNGN